MSYEDSQEYKTQVIAQFIRSKIAQLYYNLHAKFFLGLIYFV